MLFRLMRIFFKLFLATLFFFFFSSRRRHTRSLRDWSSDVCSSDLRTKKIQRDHIGRSEGAELIFRVEEIDRDIPVFTTRPDTVFGATFFVVAPESPLVDELVEGAEAADEVRAYARVAAARPTKERASREKSGVFTGRYAINPANGERIPIWVADYVLMEYGTGAIMAV